MNSIDRVYEKVDNTRKEMFENVKLITDNTEKLEDIEKDVEELQHQSSKMKYRVRESDSETLSDKICINIMLKKIIVSIIIDRK